MIDKVIDFFEKHFVAILLVSMGIGLAVVITLIIAFVQLISLVVQ